MNASQKAPFGFLVVGTLIGAAIGAVLSDHSNVHVNTIVGMILGLLMGVAADVLLAKLQPKILHVVLIGLIAVSLASLASLFRSLVVPKSPDEPDWLRVEQHLQQQYQIQDPNMEQTRAIAERFLAHVLADRLDAAYNVLSAEWKQKLGREGFTMLIRKQPKFKNPRLPFSSEVHESDYYYICRCRADSEEGKVVEVEIGVGRSDEHPDFRVWRYQVRDPAPAR